MRKVYITFIALCTFLISYGQKELRDLVNITGTVKDSVTNQPLANATVRLTRLQKPEHNYTTVADDAGQFTIRKVLPGSYELSVEFVGYTVHSDKNIVLDSSKTEWDLAPIYLPTKSKTLGNVVVTGTRSLVENKIDRIVYNVDKDITSQGGVATDVLRKIPQVSVDVNGNVELLGNPSIRFLINGKPSVIFGNSIADALQSIPASQIQSIEVMSSPGAKYDATGTGGVINIILKKNKARGLSGVVNATAGTRQDNGSLNLNFKKDNIAISAYFSGSALVKVKTLSDLTRNSIDTVSKSIFYLRQNGSNDFIRNGFRTGGCRLGFTTREKLVTFG
jgi:outer membrane receptor protein involved in Fe transport